jgi:outer membrane protein TolC
MGEGTRFKAGMPRIGINKAALFPSFSISGFLGFQGSDVGAFTLGDTFSHNAFTASASPSLVLPFLNYGRLYNAVRAQDAVFQQSLVTYKQTVLQALQEAENAMSSFIRSRQRLTLLQQAAEAAGRSTKLALEQYNAGSTDFTTVVSAQTTQYQQENSVAAAAGNTALQAVALFRALGGGWQPQPLPLPKATIDAMKKRTDWGGMLRDMENVPVAGQSEIPQAETHRGY